MLVVGRCLLTRVVAVSALQSKQLSTSYNKNVKNPYLTPTRDIILQNEKLKNSVNVKTEASSIEARAKPMEIVFKNTNPRHMEHLGYNKPAGFTTLHEKRNFYNKLTLDVTNRHTKAFVENISGDIVCYASTTEHYIAKRLHSTTDVSAAINIARVLAERCKQVGIERVHWFTYVDRTTEKMQEFENILRNSGMILSELPTKVLQGPSRSLPSPRKKRVFPGPLNTSTRKKGTVSRKEYKTQYLSRVTLD